MSASPSHDDEKQAQVTVRMTVREAEIFMQLLSEGKLEHLGITEASVASPGGSQVRSHWTESEGLRRISAKNVGQSNLP